MTSYACTSPSRARTAKVASAASSKGSAERVVVAGEPSVRGSSVEMTTSSDRIDGVPGPESPWLSDYHPMGWSGDVMADK